MLNYIYHMTLMLFRYFTFGEKMVKNIVIMYATLPWESFHKDLTKKLYNTNG